MDSKPRGNHDGRGVFFLYAVRPLRLTPSFLFPIFLRGYKKRMDPMSKQVIKTESGLKSTRWIESIYTYGRMIKFSHTIFALPFALVTIILVQRQYVIQTADIGWVILAMVGARSAAMGFNRVVDARMDEKNPRTCMREIPNGSISSAAAWFFVVISSAGFLFAAGMLGRRCTYLAIPILAILFSYSYAKRFTWLSHLYLGFAISLAPWGTWIALSKSFFGPIWLLSVALLTYIAGFDILYACQDIDFDRKEGLHSIPATFGPRRALQIASALHVIAFIAFAAIFPVFKMNMAYLVTLVMIGLLLVVEHRIVRPDDFSRVNVAFFYMNSLVSMVLFLGVLMDEILRRQV